MTSKNKIIIFMEGGLIQDICAEDRNIEVVVVDYDADEYGESDDDRVSMVPQSPTETQPDPKPEPAWVTGFSIDGFDWMTAEQKEFFSEFWTQEEVK